MPSDPPRSPPGIGHNSHKPDQLKLIAWRRVIARQPKPSPMVVRRRMERAEELGMTYADYAAVYRAAGRDPAALVFSPASLGLTLGRRLSIDPRTSAHLGRVQRCHLMCLCPPEEDPAAFAEELAEVTQIRFTSAAPLPEPDAPWSRLRQIVRMLLDPVRLNGNAALMIGDGRAERSLFSAGRMGDYLAAPRYFSHLAPPGQSAAASRTP